MKVCIVSDDKFFSLQQYALEQGHDVYVHVPGLTKRRSVYDFAVFPLARHQYRNLHQVTSLEEAWEIEADIYLCGTQNDDYAYEELKLRSQISAHKPVICGYDRTALLLEHDRSLAFDLNLSLPELTTQNLRMPKQRVFTSQKVAARFLAQSSSEWVVKQHSSSPLEIDRNRTVIASAATSHAVATMLGRSHPSNPWFREDGSGGCVLEQRVSGLEVSFGAWFNGQRFVGPTYLYEEHKGAWPGSLGNIMTGEVGTTMTWMPWDDGRACAILRALEPKLAGHCCGMVDINTILDAKGNLWFLEYTMRFGRPTLEMQIAGPGQHVDLIKWWFAASQEPAVNVAAAADGGWSDSCFKTSVGVTVFSYGIPLVEEGGYSYPVAVPKAKNRAQKVMQLFATHSFKHQSWMAEAGDRQFLAVGTNRYPEIARAEAYSILSDYEAHELVWRPDIGNNTVQLLWQAKHCGLIGDADD